MAGSGDRRGRSVDDIRVLLAARKGPAASRLERAIANGSTWSVTRVAAGDAVLRTLEQQVVTLVVLDSQLPIVRPYELCRILRGRPETAGVAIAIAEFGTLDDSMSGHAAAFGADAYLDARHPGANIMKSLRRLVQKRNTMKFQASGPAYDNGRLIANFADLFISVDGKLLTLGGLEIALLRYLVERKNRVVSRQELFESVWDGRDAISSRTVDIHVCRLRRKLGPAGEQIQTLAPVGYRFVDTELLTRKSRRTSRT